MPVKWDEPCFMDTRGRRGVQEEEEIDAHVLEAVQREPIGSPLRGLISSNRLCSRLGGTHPTRRTASPILIDTWSSSAGMRVWEKSIDWKRR